MPILVFLFADLVFEYSAMSDLEGECYVSGCQSCTQVARGYDAVAKHMQRAGSILDDQSLTTSNGVLENLKRHRDHFLSFKVSHCHSFYIEDDTNREIVGDVGT